MRFTLEIRLGRAAIHVILVTAFRRKKKFSTENSWTRLVQRLFLARLIYVSSYKCSTFSASIRITSRVNIVKKTKRQTTQVVAVTVVLVVVGDGSVTGIVSNRVDVVNHVR